MIRWLFVVIISYIALMLACAAIIRAFTPPQ